MLPAQANDLQLTFQRWSRQLAFRAMQDIDEISDISGELMTVPGEPLAQALPPNNNRKRAAAIAVSFLLHGAVAAIFLISPAATLDFQDAMQTEGSDQAGTDVVGSESDGQTPGAVNVTLVPAPLPARPVAAKSVMPSDPATRVAATPSAEPRPEAAKQPAAPDILATGRRQDDETAAPASEAPAHSVVQSESAEEPTDAIGQPPIPSSRPRMTAGAGGTAKTNDARGAADGQEIHAAIASKGKKSAAAGKAAASRYSGEVASKLARANRRVSKAAQTKARNNATVAFVVLANGSITDLQLARSSGSPELDQFALNLVRQQAPFPPIPPEIGISSWRFKAPIGPY